MKVIIHDSLCIYHQGDSKINMGQESSVEEYKVVNVKENVTGVAGEENPAFFSFEITEEMKKEEKDVLVSVMVTSGYVLSTF